MPFADATTILPDGTGGPVIVDDMSVLGDLSVGGGVSVGGGITGGFGGGVDGYAVNSGGRLVVNTDGTHPAEVLLVTRGAHPGFPASTSGFLYVLNGALWFRGGLGTITQVAPA